MTYIIRWYRGGLALFSSDSQYPLLEFAGYLHEQHEVVLRVKEAFNATIENPLMRP